MRAEASVDCKLHMFLMCVRKVLLLRAGNILWRPEMLEWTLIDFGVSASIGAHCVLPCCEPTVLQLCAMALARGVPLAVIVIRTACDASNAFLLPLGASSNWRC